MLGGSSQTIVEGGDMSDNAVRRPRWRPFVSFAALLALVALLVPVFPRPPSKGIRDRFDQIQNGMTEDQVEKLLGGPRGVYDKTRWDETMTAIGTGSGRSHLSWWYFPDCAIEVRFDEDGRVDGKRIEPPPPQSLVETTMQWCKQTFSRNP
jgi:outer membrane protein assembly factor BamE (lipoprotein component of BamABCDE complex)